MKQTNFNGQKSFGSNTVSINVPIISFQEDELFYVYMPSLDLTGYGDTEKIAMESFMVVLDEFFRYTINKNTLLVELKRLGWKIKSKKKPMHAPQFSELINTNEQLKDIVNYKQYTTSNFDLNVPAFA